MSKLSQLQTISLVLCLSSLTPMTQQIQTETQSSAVFLVQEQMVLISSQKFPNYPVRSAKAKVWSSTQNGVHLTTA
ncbi:hexokinase [Candida albicans P57072]|nr:hexokinase [Candida albicans P57072]KHC28060.1 hexokinase [Candida albicans P76055]KHC28548.1 hexokinase [Candida albicans P76067]KHC28755.1 hexokinase [Candida albicans Ca6]KHC43999.1 hexokinase [Candida albicans P60002]